MSFLLYTFSCEIHQNVINSCFIVIYLCCNEGNIRQDSVNKSTEHRQHAIIINWGIVGMFQSILHTSLSKHSLTGIVSGMWQTNRTGWKCLKEVMSVELSFLTNVAEQRKAARSVDCSSAVFSSSSWTDPHGFKRSWTVHLQCIYWTGTCTSLFFVHLFCFFTLTYVITVTKFCC